MKKLFTILMMLMSVFALGQPGLFLGNYPSGGSIGAALDTYESNSLVHIAQTTAGQTLTLPVPTDWLAGKNFVIDNNGTVPFTLIPGGVISPLRGLIFRWDGANFIVIGSISSADLPSTAVQTTGTYTNPSWIPSYAWSKISSTPTSLAGYGIADPVVLTSNSYTNPAWIVSMPWSKITSQPTIPAAQVNSDWNAGSGLSQILNKPTIPAAQVNADWNSVSGVSQILNKPSIPSGQIQSDWNQASSGVVDFIKNKPTIPTNTNQLTNGAGFITGNQTITVSGDVTGSGATTITTTLANSGVTAGTYPLLTVNSKGIVTAGSAPTASSVAAGARNFNQAYQVSSTRAVDVRMSVSISCSLSLSGGTAGNIFMEYSADGSTNWTLAGNVPSSNTGALTIGLSTVQIGGGQVSCFLPAGYYWRLRTSTGSGTPTYSHLGGQEIVY